MSPETFDADWLALRESVDHRSRPDPLVARLARWWEAAGASHVLDLGSGTGSNLRYLAPCLTGPQAWTLLDQDRALLDRVRTGTLGVTVTPTIGDLAHEGIEQIAEAHLVTASALLDLVTADWMEEAVLACMAARASALFALTYDGMIEWSDAPGGDDQPPDEDLGVDDDLRGSGLLGGDELVREAVNAHQRRDKGLGPALGPEAGRFAIEAFRNAGYEVVAQESPWRLRASDAELVLALLNGWATAAAEERPREVRRLAAWAKRRREIVARGDFELVVGHVDLLALPRDGGKE